MYKIKNIEFLRIIGCIAIVALHYFRYINANLHIYSTPADMVMEGRLAVELFFILSGLFFALKFNSQTSLIDFLKNKIIRLFPVLLFCFGIYWVLSLFKITNFTFYENILSIFGLSGTPLVIKYANLHHFWYCSAMLWVLFFYAYLIKNFKKENATLIIALLSFFSYGIILHINKGGFYAPIKMYNGFINVGLLRAAASIGLGYLIGEWYKNNQSSIKKITLNLKAKLFISCIEFICLYFIINNLLLHNPRFTNKFVFIIAFAVIIILFLLRQGIFSKILENNLWTVFSKYTYSIYMIHIVIIDFLKGSVWKSSKELIFLHPYLNIFFSFLAIFIAGVMIYHLIEKPCYNYLKRKSLSYIYIYKRGGQKSNQETI